MINEGQLIEFISKKEHASFLDIAKKFNIPSRENKNLSLFLNKLKDENKIFFSKRFDCYFIAKLVGNYDVEFIVNQRKMQFCFFKQDENDIEKRALIFKNNLNVLKGDLVNVNIYEDLQDGFYFATMNFVVEIKNQNIYAQVNEDLSITPISFHQVIDFKYDKSTLNPNTFVIFSIKKVHRDYVELELQKTMYSTNEPFSDINFIVDISSAKKQFDQTTINESNLIPDEVENVKDYNRVDISNDLIVTIDGEKTKDFDDAISVVKKENGNYILGVHIADVAYYVKEDSAIDLEARQRGTSIYLIEKVIPMLPEKLSNGICSLNPNVERFTITLESEIDKNGKIINQKIYPSLIKSKYRLTYNQVENYKNDLEINKDQNLFKMIEWAYELSSILSKNKYNDGYIDFEIIEPIIEVDKETGKTIAIDKRIRKSSEILIENFMVFANESVSKIISDLKIPSIYRIHDCPDLEKCIALKNFLRTIGINDINFSDLNEPKKFQMIVDKLKKIRFDNLVKMALLKTMQKAKYSTDNIGHFGLASKYYSHFTSPIRRYPDLLLHRIIWEVIFKKNHNYSIEKEKLIKKIAADSSEAEINAVDLERKVNDVKKAEFYESMIGQIKESIVTSVHRFGIFVEFEDMTSSLIHISNITQSKDYEVSEDMSRLIIQSENKTYKVGQTLKVKIISINKMEGKIDSIIL